MSTGGDMLDGVGHFAWSELACHDPVRGLTPYPADWREDPTRGIPLMRTLNVIRDEVRDQVGIVSGFRTPEHNADLIADDNRRGLHGVASGSQHLDGKASDIETRAMTPADLHALIWRLWKDGRLPQLGGLGLYPGWVHIDVRERTPPDHLAQWGLRIME